MNQMYLVFSIGYIWYFWCYLTIRDNTELGDAAVHSGAPGKAGGGLEARGGGGHCRGHDGQP